MMAELLEIPARNEYGDSSWYGRAQVYRLDPPYEHTGGHYDETLDEYVEHLELIDYVIASAVIVPVTGSEVYFFPCNANGQLTDWGELPFSERGTLDIVAVLENAGFTIKNKAIG